MKKFLMVSLALFFSLSVLIPSIGAETVTEVSSNAGEDFAVTQPGYEFIDEEGNTLIFETEEDFNKYQQAHNSSNNIFSKTPIITPFASKETKKLVSSGRYNNVWVGYHPGTPNWQKRNRHEGDGKTYKVNGSYTYQGISVNIGFTYKATYSLIADPKRLSRVGVYGDYTFRKFKVTVKDPIGTWSYHKVEKIRHSSYQRVKYK